MREGESPSAHLTVSTKQQFSSATLSKPCHLARSPQNHNRHLFLARLQGQHTCRS